MDQSVLEGERAEDCGAPSGASLASAVPALLAAAIDAVSDSAIYIVRQDEAATIVYANQATSDLFGEPLDEIVGTSVLPRIVDASERHFNRISAILSARGRAFVTNDVQRRGSGPVTVDVRLFLFNLAGTAHIVVISRESIAEDLRDRVLEAERADRILFERLSHYASVAPGVLISFVFDENGCPQATYVTNGFEDLTGIPADPLEGARAALCALMSNPDWQAIAAEAEADPTGHQSVWREFRIHHPSKGERWIELIANHSTASVGGRHFHGYLHDITDRKRIETALIVSQQNYKDVFDNTSDRICILDLHEDGRLMIAAMNPANDATFGPGVVARLVGLDARIALPSTSGQDWCDTVVDSITRNVVRTYELEAELSPAVGPRRMLIRIVPVADGQGAIRRAICFAQDLNDEQQAQLERFNRRQQFQNLVEQSLDPIVRYDVNLRRTYVNNAFAALFNVPQDQVLGQTPSLQPIIDPGSAVAYNALLTQTLAGEPSTELIISIGINGRNTRWISVRALCERDPEGRPIGVMVIGREVTERIKAERQLADRERDFRQLVENSPDMISRHDPAGRRIYENPAYRWRLGNPETGWCSLSQSDQDRLLDGIRAVAGDGVARDLEMLHTGIDGRDWWSHISVVPEYEGDRITSVLCIGRDVTETVIYRERIMRAAYFDALTDLPNRTRLLEEASRWIARGGAFAMMVMDLDGFKEVNDGLGHEAGDALLRIVARRLSIALNGDGVVARLGGDEFAIMVNTDDCAETEALAQRLLKAVVEPSAIAGREIFISASIGIARYPVDGEDVDQLLRYADAAMYRAKADGRNGYRLYTADMSARAVERMVLASSLRKADQRGELVLHYQPQFDLADGRLTGVEALLRWRHPELGLIMPDRFISIAEETGLIIEIGRWVLYEACRTVVRWNQDRTHPIRMSVNLSARQFVLNDLSGMVRDCLDETQCRPEWLELEITESLLLGDHEVVTCLDEISASGVSIAIDDFGTGYSALGYLHRFPIHTLKIDRSFMQGIEHDKRKSGIVRAIISIASALDMRLVAEGVETLRQVNVLDGYGCHAAQGYYFGRPVAEDEFQIRHLGGSEPENPWDCQLAAG